MHEMELLRVPLAFGRTHADITLSEGRAVATSTYNTWRAAASKVVMRSGRHFAQFTLVEGLDIGFGVARPDCLLDGGVGDTVDGHVYATNTGGCFPDHLHWEGMQGAEQGDRIGMLLDLDQGSMTVWKNDVKLGVMVAAGLRGPLCWAAELSVGNSVRIESAPANASPTEEELAAATTWQKAHT